MNLSELIEETLNEIAIGIKNSREASKDIIAIAPGKFGGKFAPELTEISFDVALVVTDAADQKSLDKSGLSGRQPIRSAMGGA